MRSITRYLLLSLIFHGIALGFLGAASKAPFGGGSDRVIVVNLVSLGIGQGGGRGPGLTKPDESGGHIHRQSHQGAQLLSKGEGENRTQPAGTAGVAHAHADSSSEDRTPAQGGSGSGNTLLFGAGGLDRVPALAEYREIEYPREARRAKLEGEVVVKILISREGRVDAVEVTRSTDKILEDAVLTAVKQWRFEPPTVRGRPVSLWMITPFRFRLE